MTPKLAAFLAGVSTILIGIGAAVAGLRRRW